MDRDDDRSRDKRLDDLVRSAFDTGPGSVQRIVANALSGEGRAVTRPSRRRSVRLLEALPVAAVLVLIGVAVATSLWQRTAPPAPAPRGAISNQGDIIVVTAPDRPITLIGSSSTAPPAPRGTVSIVLLGEPQ